MCFWKDDGRKVNKATKISAQFSAIQQSKKKLKEGRRSLFSFLVLEGEKIKEKQKKKVKQKRRIFTFFLEGKKKRGLLGWYRNNNFVREKTKISFLVEIIEAPV
jgi:hypothetical protein